jgi:hypothetical protein
VSNQPTKDGERSFKVFFEHIDVVEQQLVQIEVFTRILALALQESEYLFSPKCTVKRVANFILNNVLESFVQIIQSTLVLEFGDH